MATVEERVERLEQQAAQRLDAQLDAGLRATAYGISLVQVDVAEVKADLRGVKADLAEVKSDVIDLGTDAAELKTDVAGLREQTRTDFAAVNAKLDAILARLPG